MYNSTRVTETYAHERVLYFFLHIYLKSGASELNALLHQKPSDKIATAVTSSVLRNVNSGPTLHYQCEVAFER